jgi:DNA-binding IclR family transcriptional regulator
MAMAKKDNTASEGQASRPNYFAPALEKGFNVVELLARNPQGLTVSEIASGLGLSISEIFRIIMVMERRQWLRKIPGDKYRVTPAVLDLAFRATPAEELAVVATPHMREFARITDQSCHLVIRNGHKGLVIMRQQNPGPTGFYVRVGMELDLEATCSGHVLLAFGLPSGAPEADDTSERLQGILNAVRQRGYERMESARTLGVTDVSYPIFDFHGQIAAALTVPFLRLIDGTQTVHLDEAQQALADTVKAITADLAGKEPF